jgi:hypothetical protein
MWHRDPSYVEQVNSAWAKCGPGLRGVQTSLRNMQSSLQLWDKEVFGSVRNNLKKLQFQLEAVRRRNWRSGPSREEQALLGRISELLAREEVMLRQRSRIQWLAAGDRNTGYFHAKCRARARQNWIHSLTLEDGSTCSDQNVLKSQAKSFYKNLFKAQDDCNLNAILQFVPGKVSNEMNNFLCRPFDPGEVETALFMMKPNKSPGPDGFTAGFFQRHWAVIKDTVCEAVLDFLNGGEMPGDLNSTILVLIPKIKHPQDLTQFRPIALCNVLYKICSKAIANRLRSVLDEIIAEEQSAFVPGRLISDNILTAYECFHYLKRKKGKSPDCAIKLDMAKAYDRIEWTYLEEIMVKLGFARPFISLIMKCVISVSFRVKLNGRLSDSFLPSRGLRQWDPISPYLFLLCAEDFSCLLKYSGPMFLARGIRVVVH